jgi:DNA-binding NarL/FixJ family response regulator
MNAIVVGPDRGIADALESEGVEVTRIEGVASGERLVDAGVEDADLLVVTDVAEATAIPVARERNPDLKVVAYTPDSMPEFVKGVLDLAVDPALLDAETVAEELV